MADYKYGEITEKKIGAAFRVHGTVGNGFQEVIYQRALHLELKAQNLQFSREFELPVYYLDQQIGTKAVDFPVEGKIRAVLKATIKWVDVHLVQAIHYWEAYNLE